MVANHKYSPRGKLDYICAIALGSNQKSQFGDSLETLQKSLDLLTQQKIKVISTSPFYQTPSFPPDSGPVFVNSAALLQGNLSPHEILTALHTVESQMGRVRTKRWGPRVVDMDLIFHGDLVLPNQKTFNTWHDLPPDAQRVETPTELILPHPRLKDRAFVLVPLADIAPDWVHPVLNKTVVQMRDALPKAALNEVERL